MKGRFFLVFIVFIFAFISCKSENPVHHVNKSFDDSDVNENLSFDTLDILESDKQRVELLGEYVSDSDHNHTLFTNLRVTNTESNEMIVNQRIVDDSTGIPELILADFTGDKLDEVMVVIHRGGNHDYEKEYQFYSIANQNLISLPKEGLLDEESLNFSVENEKGKFYSKKLNIQYEVNLSEKLLELYKNEPELLPDKNYTFEPIFIESDGVYGLKGDLYLFDAGLKEFIARFEMLYKLEKSKWVLVKLKLLESD